ncbi:MAG TPA: hypothetical protein VFH48_03750 [Chloroflexota bacterium]|nr:hypothetical protein [Chloroflexota bacterium]
MIRPPDPAIRGTTMRYMPVTSAEAVRRLAHLAFRDCTTALDLTYAHRGFWRDPLPPGLTVTSNNVDPASAADLHLDFTATGLPDAAYDLVVLDPPHIANGGARGIMAMRYGTVKGLAALRELIEAGAREAWRVSRVGILVKVADYAHQGRHQQLSRWVEGAVPVPPYTVLHTFKPTFLRDGKHRATRVPRNNGAVWFTFRASGHRHLDFDGSYDRQQAHAGGEAAAI